MRFPEKPLFVWLLKFLVFTFLISVIIQLLSLRIFISSLLALLNPKTFSHEPYSTMQYLHKYIIENFLIQRETIIPKRD